MTPASQRTTRADQEEMENEPRRYRLELSRAKMVVCAAGLLMGLVWMFVFGVLVGRGLPLDDGGQNGLKAQFLHFLGLDVQQPPPPQNVAETWETPEKMLGSLTYFQDLTQTDGKNSIVHPSPEISTQKAPASEGRDLLTKREKKPAVEAVPRGGDAEEAGVRATQDRADPQGGSPLEKPSEYYTLLVGSLKEVENAQKLAEQLKAKGYETRLETLDLSDSGRWNRVLVGTFESRDAAMSFAVDFNRKEHMQGLVIRESN